jgi:hypothetical protein
MVGAGGVGDWRHGVHGGGVVADRSKQSQKRSWKLMATDIHGGAPGSYTETFAAGSVLDVRPEAQVIGVVKAAKAAASGLGYTLARGEVTLDGSNPTSVVIVGLSTIVGATVTLKQATAPGDDPVALTCDYGGAVPAGRLDIYAWKTDGTDPTLVASTNAAAVISWIAIGDPA